MAKSSNNLSGIINKISKSRGSAGGARLTNLVSESTAGSTSAKTVKPIRSSDLKAVSDSAKSTPNPIRFGTAPSQRTTTSSSGSEWSNLLKQTASGGIASILGGGMGIGSLVSSIGNLFGGGGGTAAPPVVAFQLPSSQEHTLYLSSQGTEAGRTGSGIYGSTKIGTSGVGGQILQYQSSQIAQAVKTALLNSSSLNDVIAEI